MAYFLRKTAATPSARVDVAPGISISSALSSWSIEFKVKLTATDLVLLGAGQNDSANIVFIRQSTCEVRRSAGGNVTFNLPQDPRTAERIYVLRTSGTGIELLQDGVSCGVLGTSKNLFTINNLLTLGNTTRIGDLYYIEITINGVLVHNYDPSASNGTGTTLIDTVGGNNGTLVNFPTDNSQWVFYDDGAGSVDIETSGLFIRASADVSVGSVIETETSVSSGLFLVSSADLVAGSSFSDSVSKVSGAVFTAFGRLNAGTSWSETTNTDDTAVSGLVIKAASFLSAGSTLEDEVSVKTGFILRGVASLNAGNAIGVVTEKRSGSFLKAFAKLQAGSSWIESSPAVDVVLSGLLIKAGAKVIAGSSFIESTSQWGEPVELFEEPLPIQQISLTFDQLGRPLVFYRVNEDTLKLYWYDPVLQQNVLTVFGQGIDPLAAFDFPQDTGQSFTDVLLFYVRNNRIYMRVQRDRYAIEYPASDVIPGVRLRSAGLRVDNRFQVEYIYPEVT